MVEYIKYAVFSSQTLWRARHTGTLTASVARTGTSLNKSQARPLQTLKHCSSARGICRAHHNLLSEHVFGHGVVTLSNISVVRKRTFVHSPGTLQPSLSSYQLKSRLYLSKDLFHIVRSTALKLQHFCQSPSLEHVSLAVHRYVSQPYT